MKSEDGGRSLTFSLVKPGDLRKVLGRIRRNGPLTIRDIDDDVLVEKIHEWASRKPSKRALQLAFFRGILTVSRREGMLKTYELTTRHFGWDRLPKAAPESERTADLLDRGLSAARVRRKELVPVALDGSRPAHWAAPGMLAAALAPAADIVHILTPFDP